MNILHKSKTTNKNIFKGRKMNKIPEKFIIASKEEELLEYTINEMSVKVAGEILQKLIADNISNKEIQRIMVCLLHKIIKDLTYVSKRKRSLRDRIFRR